jgi:hypothetical protein
VDKPLYAIVTCGKRKDHADAQRETWVKDVMTADVRFFLATQDREPLPDEVFLDVGDGYDALPTKVRAVNRWAIGEGYDRMLKLDDDVVVFPGRVINPTGSYAGWKQEPAGVKEGHCAGMAYWLTADLMQVLAQAEIPRDEMAEDRWVGRTLHAAEVRPQTCHGIQWFGKISSRTQLPFNWRARISSCWVAAEFSPQELRHVYIY